MVVFIINGGEVATSSLLTESSLQQTDFRFKVPNPRVCSFGGLLLILRSLHHDEPGGEHGKSGNLESLRLDEHVLFLRRFW